MKKNIKQPKKGIEIKKNRLQSALCVIDDKNVPGQFLLINGHTRLALALKLVKQ